MRNRRRVLAAAAGALVVALAVLAAAVVPGLRAGGGGTDGTPAAGDRPHVFVYNLDDLRDAFPGGIDPLRYMPQVRRWMAAGTRYTQSFVADPSCCPSRSSLMTGRYPHNNGVLTQQDGPSFDSEHSMACYLRDAGYATYEDGKFLTTWPRERLPPCFDHSTVMWGGYEDVQVKVDGVPRQAAGYDTTYLGRRGREYIDEALGGAAPFLLYETPQAPHWVDVPAADGTTRQLAVPDAKYRDAPVRPCAGVPEDDRDDKPDYVRTMDYTRAQAEAMCRSQLRAVMTADDEFGATMRLLQTRGVLDDTLVVFTSDNGYMWGEHGRWEKFVPYEPSLRVPMLLRWPGHVPAATETRRTVSYLDLLPTLLDAAGVGVPAGAPALDGESLLQPSRRSTMYSEYYTDQVANKNVPSWRMLRTSTLKYIQTYDGSGAVTDRELYDLAADPAENTNLLGDADPANDPSPATVRRLDDRLTAFSTCSGRACVQG